ncbi:hypothetical protein [Caballeronia sp. AZ10_KS36]|uniref:hypothetical protein n=1 Tax=Caballeronia sp. AZ10_KS36 TaxID=2921757 RepID=UPI0020276FDA|nr:hypothetical protein [Caballeronia sp. AZ10_KS36]
MSQEHIECECPECGAPCLVDDGNYVAISALPAPSATVDLSKAADELEAEYLKVANGEIKVSKMRLEPLVRAVQAMRAAS